MKKSPKELKESGNFYQPELKMQIRNFLKESFINYPDKISSVVFVPGCNLRCSACHARHLLEPGKNKTEEEFFKYLNSRKGWIEAVVLCGGEPNLQPDLAEFARRLKSEGLLVKLDTNGINPEVLSGLNSVVDYVAMDVKGTRELYAQITGVSKSDLNAIEKSMKIVQNFPAYEFRTTVVPVEREPGKIECMTVPEIAGIARWIRETTGNNFHRYYLQPFVPKKGGLINHEFEELPETTPQLLKEAKLAAITYLPNTLIR